MIGFVVVVIFHFIEAEGFVDTAADAIATDGGFANFFRNDDGETLEVARIWAENQSCVVATNGFSVAVNVIYAAA